MQRTTITLDDELIAQLDAFAAHRGYQNRSEAVRDLLRAGLGRSTAPAQPDLQCVAAAVYVYDHEARDLARRLTRAAHSHHDLSLATLHVHLDHDTCMEVTVLRGRAGDVAHYADHVIAERGVRHGQLVLVPVELHEEAHEHGVAGRQAHRHLHIRSRS